MLEYHLRWILRLSGIHSARGLASKTLYKSLPEYVPKVDF